jgi:hypothetical protein
LVWNVCQWIVDSRVVVKVCEQRIVDSRVLVKVSKRWSIVSRVVVKVCKQRSVDSRVLMKVWERWSVVSRVVRTFLFRSLMTISIVPLLALVLGPSFPGVYFIVTVLAEIYT